MFYKRVYIRFLDLNVTRKNVGFNPIHGRRTEEEIAKKQRIS